MALYINDNITSSKSNLANLDSKYGPYTTINAAINQLVPNKQTLDITNGYTFGIKGVSDTGVIEYAFCNIAPETTPQAIRASFNDYVKRKVNDTKVVLKKADGTVIGYFTLNQAANGDIEITIPGDEQVQSDWSETDTTAKSYIENKPDLSNVVYFEDLPSK